MAEEFPVIAFHVEQSFHRKHLVNRSRGAYYMCGIGDWLSLRRGKSTAARRGEAIRTDG